MSNAGGATMMTTKDTEPTICNSENPNCKPHANFSLAIYHQDSQLTYWVGRYGCADREVTAEQYRDLVKLKLIASLETISEVMSNALRADDCDDDTSVLRRILGTLEDA